MLNQYAFAVLIAAGIASAAPVAPVAKVDPKPEPDPTKPLVHGTAQTGPDTVTAFVTTPACGVYLVQNLINGPRGKGACGKPFVYAGRHEIHAETVREDEDADSHTCFIALDSTSMPYILGEYTLVGHTAGRTWAAFEKGGGSDAAKEMASAAIRCKVAPEKVVK
jgi:hypothetical protein